MPWYTLGIGRRQPSAVTASATPEPAAVTAAASPVKGPQTQFLQHTQQWQAEVWRYYDTLGEFNTAVTWLGSMLSRVRIRAAELSPDLDEPTIVDAGPAAEVIGSMSGGVGGQAQLMRNLTVQLAAPGDCYLIGQDDSDEGDGGEVWTVRSIDEVRVQSGRFQVVTDRVPTITWSDLPAGSMPVRVWRPHARFFHLADSVAKAAIPIMNELELVNRHIVAQYLSRLASAGLLIMPTEVEIPVREEFADAPDPFTAEFIEIAAEAIRTPGTASAVIPIPVKMPGEFIDKVRHIDFTLKIDEKIIDKRNSVINRLANKLDIPSEILTGRAQTNHWTAWFLDEDALKTHIAPMAEIICDSLTRGYLWPRLKASGMSPKEYTQYVVWYDMSELALRPDRSENAQAAYDRLELSGEALRREGGFDENDKPSAEELVQIGLKAMLRNTPGAAPEALDALAGRKVIADIVPQSAASPPVSGGNPTTSKQPGPAKPAASPGTEEKPPPAKPGPPKSTSPSSKPPSASAEQRAELVSRQVREMHALRFGIGASGELLHPPVCRDHAYSCPFTHAAEAAFPSKLTTGTYECHLDTVGRLSVGQVVPYLETSDWLVTPGYPGTWKGHLNGHATL
jgi:hypothetical protein